MKYSSDDVTGATKNDTGGIKESKNYMDDNNSSYVDEENSDVEPQSIIVKPEIPETGELKNIFRGQRDCTICDKICSSKQKLEKHMALHTNEKPFTCDECAKNFRFEEQLNQHKIVHSEIKPFSCHCGVQFTVRNSLKRHQLRIHSKDKESNTDNESEGDGNGETTENYTELSVNITRGQRTCNVCEKILSSKQALEYHMIRHTGKKPFMCDLCDKSFFAEAQLNQHMFVHSESKPFSCYCGVQFTVRNSLKRHQQHAHNQEKIENWSDGEIL